MLLTSIAPIKKKIVNENKINIICLEEELDKVSGSLEILQSVKSPNKINEENKIKDIENTKNQLSNDSEIKNFLDEFDGEIEAVTKIKNQK